MLAVFILLLHCYVLKLVQVGVAADELDSRVFKSRPDLGNTLSNVNEILVLISEDALVSPELEESTEFYSNYLFKNVVLTLSKSLNRNFFLCNYFLSFEDDTNENCINNNINTLNYKQKYDKNYRQLRILTYKLNSSLGFDDIKRIHTKIKHRASSKQNLKLNSILFISNTKLLSMFRLVFNRLSNSSIFYLDIEKFSDNSFNFNNQVFKSISKELHNANQNDQSVQFKNINPTIDSVLEIINYFRSLNNLENVHIYLTNTKENLIFVQRKTSFAFIDEIKIVKKLIEKLSLLNSIDDYFGKYTLERRKSSDDVLESFKKIKKFFYSNDLIVLKCSLGNLHSILNLYNSLKTKYFSHHLSNMNFYRHIIWIPENELDSAQDYKLILRKISQICNLFRIYILNWIVDVDLTIHKIIERTSSINDLILSGKFSLKLFDSFNFINGSICEEKKDQQVDKAHTEFYFKVKDNKIFLIDSSSFTDPYEDTFSYLKLVNPPKRTKRPSFKPSYRIVSNRVEPFVIVSQLDEHLVSKDECKDGLPCLDIESDEILFNTALKENSNLSQEMNNIFNKELMIGLIKGFKYFSDDKIQSNKTNLVKTKCCTGYMINLLQRLSTDLDFDFEFYFSPDKKYGHFNNKTSAWTGAINHVISDVAHIAAGPLSITADRSKFVDFSIPFLYSGYALLIKQEKKGVDDLWMFMKPFTYLHWALIFLCAFGSAFSLALLEFNSPFGLNPMGRQRARNYTLGSAISMVISLMFMHTMPAKSPKSWAGKWTQNFIASFALIFIATYTAQMASILSAGQDSMAFKGIDDRELLTLKRGYLHSSSIESHMCKNSKEFYKSHCKNSITLNNDNEGIQSVLNGSLDVYISDHLLLNYMRFKQTDCNLQITGKDFSINGYALALSKKMSLKEKNDINIQLLDYYETGYLDELYNKWFNKRVKCNRKAADEKIRIDVDQYKGVYAYLGLGMLTAVFVLFLEQALYKWTIPFLRDKPKKSNWKSLKLMFISQRFYRIVHSEELYDAAHSAKEFINVFKRRDFEAIFQKSFRKKQLESMHASQLRKRPKLWALIEASTERRSKDLINQTSSSETIEDEKQELEIKQNLTVENLPKDKILIIKYDDVKEKEFSASSETLTEIKESPIDKYELVQNDNEYDDKFIGKGYNNKIKLRREKSVTDSIDFDEQMYLAVVSTPALDEPEMFNISSSSGSLLALKSDLSFNNFNLNQSDNLNKISNESLDDNKNETLLADNPKLKEYKLIHAMFAKKNKFESKKN